MNAAADLGTATHLGAGVECMKEAVADAVEYGIEATERAVKLGSRAAEDLVDDAEYKIKKASAQVRIGRRDHHTTHSRVN